MSEPGSNVVACIFARGGSKGVPRKNIRTLAGKPLIAWAIEHAKAISRIKRVIVSTDDAEIAAIARQFGAEIPFIRPLALAHDDSPEWMAWRHAADWLTKEGGRSPDAIVSIPTTAPLRLPRDIDDCLDLFQTGRFDIVLAVTEAHRNPYFNMVSRDPDGNASLCISRENRPFRRQDAPSLFDVTTVAYVWDPKFVLTKSSIFDGRVGAVVVPKERAVDIDTALDFDLAEFLMQRMLRCGA